MSRDSKERQPRAAPAGDSPAADATRSLKSSLRKRVLAKRDALSAEKRRALSARILERVLALDAYREARCVMAYIGFGSEIDTARFVADTLAAGKTLVLPRVERGSRDLKLHAVEDLEKQLAAGVWGILQPRADLCPPVPASKLDFVLVPGVAFTRRCERLGYGGGYYDGFIRGLAGRPALVAAAYALQILSELPLTEFDQQVDFVLTERAAFRRRE